MPSANTASLRIAAASGSVTDRRHGFAALARDEDVQYIVGDWMSEYNMTTRGGAKINSNGSSEEFETSFIEAFEPALPHLADRGIKVAVNAGASDTEKLYHTVVGMIKAAGLNLTVAWVEGDEVMDTVRKAMDIGTEFKSLTSGESSKRTIGYNVLIMETLKTRNYPTGNLLPYTHNAIWAHLASLKPLRAAPISSSVDELLMRVLLSPAQSIITAGPDRITSS